MIRKIFKRILLATLTLITVIGVMPATTAYASDQRLPAAFFPEFRVDTYNRPGGTVNGFFDERTTGARVEAWGFHAGGREYWRVSFNLFAGGRATRYIRRNDLIRNNTWTDIILSQDARVFERSNLSRQAGTVWGGQRARDRGNNYSVVLASRGNSVLLVHRIDSGGGRLGWISARDLEGAIRRHDGWVWRNGAFHAPGQQQPTGNFIPRTTAPPHNVNPWIPRSAQNPFNISGGNCTWYAWGRAREILGRDPQLNRGHARYWFGNGGPHRGSETFQRGQAPRVGAIAVWGRGASRDHNYGHVSVVESVDSCGNVRLSGSNWNGQRFYITNYINVRNHRGDFLGFIYLR